MCLTFVILEYEPNNAVAEGEAFCLYGFADLGHLFAYFRHGFLKFLVLRGFHTEHINVMIQLLQIRYLLAHTVVISLQFWARLAFTTQSIQRTDVWVRDEFAGTWV